jgi:hypothetical protein
MMALASYTVQQGGFSMTAIEGSLRTFRDRDSRSWYRVAFTPFDSGVPTVRDVPGCELVRILRLDETGTLDIGDVLKRVRSGEDAVVANVRFAGEQRETVRLW